MKTSYAMQAVIEPDAKPSTEARRDLSDYPRPHLPTTSSDRIHKAKRSESWTNPITLREIATIVGLAAIGLGAFPHPLNFLTAFAMAVYFLFRTHPVSRLPMVAFGFAAWVAAAFLPAWITGEPSDFDLARTVLFFTAPVFARLATWRDRTGPAMRSTRW